MFDSPRSPASPARPAVPLDAAGVRVWRERLTATADAVARHGDDADDGERVALLRALEELTCAAAGLQAVVTARFDASQRAQQATAGVPRQRLGRGVGAQVALARRESPHRGQGHLGLATVLVEEMPHTLAALTSGRITEWRATVIARETACLTRQDRAAADLALAGTPERVAHLEGLGEGALLGLLLRLSQELDPGAEPRRRERAVAQRRVCSRPAPDGMMHLSAVLPLRDGVGVIAALSREADTLVATGDARGRGQIMADTLVGRVTGRTPAEGPTGAVIHVIVGVEDLIGTPDDPGATGAAWVDGYGPTSADVAREAAVQDAPVWMRRVFRHPTAGTLIGMDSQQRCFPEGMAEFIRIRDRVCRTPWCDAPIRHIDHIRDHAAGGSTSLTNGQGLCAACNYAKQAPGWSAVPDETRPGSPHTVTTRTPTGHSYRTTAPPLAG